MVGAGSSKDGDEGAHGRSALCACRQPGRLKVMHGKLRGPLPSVTKCVSQSIPSLATAKQRWRTSIFTNPGLTVYGLGTNEQTNWQ